MEVAKKISNLDVFEQLVKSGNALEVKKHLKKEFLHSDFNPLTQCQAIHVACKYGFVEVVKILINKKCNIEQEMIWNIKPVHIACLVGNIDILRLLLVYRCDIESLANIPTDENFDKLFDMDSENSQSISTMKTVQTRPIHIACWKGYLNIVKLMIDNDCNLQSNDKDHWKPIHVACVYGHVDILKLLLENNCTPETEDKVIETHFNWEFDKFLGNQYKTKPIHYACKTGHVEIVRILVENNCNFESQNIEKRRPIHYACKSGHVNIVKLLIHNKCNLEVEDIDGKTPLDLALENNNEVCVDMILTEIEARKKKISEMRQAFVDTPRPAPPTKERMKVTVKARIESKTEKNICKICYDREVDCVLTCGHVFCMVCGKRFSICPVCRTKSTNHIRLFLD